MNLTEFLAGLIERGVQFQRNGDQLTIRAPKNALTPEERLRLSHSKEHILAFLHEYSAEPVALYPLSIGQRALWFLYRLAPESIAYNIMSAFQVHAQVDIPALQAAFEALVERHPCLRTTYTEIGGEPAQLVHPSGQIHFEVTEAAGWSSDQLNQQLAEAADHPFDLKQGPILRVNLFTRSAREYILMLTVHHIAFDFWSLEVLLDELPQLYEAAKNKTSAVLPSLPLQFSDYVRWQTELLASPRGQQLWNYWQQHLEGELPVLDLPTDRPRPPVQTYRGGEIAFTLEPHLAQQLKVLGQAEGVTLYATLLAALNVLLYRYTGQTDILVGTAVAGRSQARFDQVIGYFVNLVVIRAYLSDDPTFKEFLKRVSQTLLNTLDHADYPFPRLVEKLQPARDSTRSPLFQVGFTWDKSRIPEPGEEAPIASGKTEPQGARDILKLEHLAGGQRGAEFDLTLTIFEQGSTLSGSWRYNIDLFEPSTIVRLSHHFQRLLVAIIDNPEQRLSRLPLLNEDNRQQLLVLWNETSTGYPAHECVHTLVEAQAARRPEAVAVVAGAGQLTYAELNRQANQLASHLQRLGVGPGTFVGICMERSLDIIVGILAILKAGGAYVPLDPSYPEERLAFMLADTQTPVILTQTPLLEHLPEHKAQVICLDRDRAWLAQADSDHLTSKVTAESPAYVMYTSGSTGRPKGIVIPHRAINRLVINTNYIELGPEDRVAFASNTAFDAATFEIWGALLHGGQLIVFDQAVMLSPRTLAARIREQHVTTLFITTALFNQVAREIPATFQPLRRLLFGGEAVDPHWVREVLEQGPPERLLHVYGPTESTTFATWHLVQAVPEEATTVPIGRPLANTQTYVLDRHLQPVPVGVPGELFLGGEGLALGYHHRPELTAERFTPNPFGKEPGSRLYKTGDLVRYLADGSIEFLGRIDHQVKLRGFRIELGEIEMVLNQHPLIQEAVVLLREDIPNDRRLVAYLVPNQAQAPQLADLRQFLKEKLPGYMTPSAFVLLEALPINPNGKIDRQALPPPQEVALNLEIPHVSPQTKLEQTIASIWAEVLNIDQVGLYDNFFDLGGHSLLIIQVHNRLQQRFGVEIAITDLFQYTTVESLSNYFAQRLNGQMGLSEPQPYVKQAHHQEGDTGKAQAIAIIGLAGRFAKAKNLEAFWRNLHDGVECISFFSAEELEAAGVDPALLRQPNYVKANGFLEDVDLFDAGFFDLNPREAALIDPQQRLFLECAWEALEHAGYDPARYPGAIGVYAGSSANTYLLGNLQADGPYDTAGKYQILLANDRDFMTTRVSYKLGLRGPSINIQTACSTSLVAVQMACQSLLNGQCEMALAGGVSITFPQKSGYLHQEGMIMSPDGHCRAFDARGQGIIGGQGVGIVVLKRLAEALADGDTIHAVIKGAAVNNDGTLKVGYTAPSVAGQAEVIALAQAAAGVEPETITYIEAHGTATPLGDPTEIAALTQAFRARTSKKGYCAIGSVKTNLGHLDAAAGVAGLIKTVLALKHQKLPPSLHFDQPNPQIDFADTPFYVNSRLSDWPRDGSPRRAGVSSFGIGGTNAHLVLEEAPLGESSAAAHPWQLLLLSAKTKSALEGMTENLAHYLKENPALKLADVAYTLQLGRGFFNHRRLVVCRDLEEAVTALESLDARHIWTAVQEAKDKPVVFMFPGQGAQHVEMAAELYQVEAVFREQVDYCAELLQPHLGLDLREVIYPDEAQISAAEAQLSQTYLTQPALFVIEYALARLWLSWGVQPQAMIGHSIGEYVAACLAGVFSLEEALTLVAVRGYLMQQLPPGAMLAVPLTEAEVRPLLGPQLSLAVINGPARCVVSGPTEAVEALQRRLAEQGVTGRRLHTSHAFHSAMMEPILESFREQVNQISLKPPRLPFISNVSGAWITAKEATDPDYWARHLRQTVRFADGLAELLKEPDWVLLEVGPGQTLSSLTQQHPAKAPGQAVVSSLRYQHDPQSDVAVLLKALGRLWLAGVKVDWAGLYGQERRRRLPLPTYPFERQRYWLGPRPQTAQVKEALPLLARKPDIADWFYVPSWKRTVMPQPFAPEVAADKALCWLIFQDECGLGAGLVEYLEQAGQEVIAVQVGEQFSRVSEATYTIDPHIATDYEALLIELHRLGRQPTMIIHLWSLTPNGDPKLSLESLDRAQDLGFYSLLFLAQAIGRRFTHPIQLEVISNNVQDVTGQERICPYKATILGPCRIIPQEYSNISCRSLDLDQLEFENGSRDTLIKRLLAEFLADPTDPVVAYRGSYRWVQTFEPVRLEAPSLDRSRLRERGVYLITGGLGGVGLVLAEYLAQAVQARLILVGRSAFPARDDWAQWLATHNDEDRVSQKIRKLLAMEALGAETLVLSGDVSDLRQMEAVITQAQKRFGAINGVIHSAGLADYAGVIQRRSREATDTILAPKVKGTLVLESLLREVQLDFFVLCSTLGSLLPQAQFGEVGYAAANEFLDTYPYYRNRQNGCFTVTINWTSWEEVGMAVAARQQHRSTQLHTARLDQKVHLEGLYPLEGIDVFRRIVASTLPRVVVSTQDLPGLRRYLPSVSASNIKLPLAENKQAQPAHTRPDLSSAYVAPRNEIESSLAGIWRELLGVEPIGIYDNFFELGGDSLLIIQVHSRLQSRVGTILAIGELFQYPTISTLAERLNQEPSPAPAQQVLERAERQRLAFARQKQLMMNEKRSKQ